jgi:hypothetical protein
MVKWKKQSSARGWRGTLEEKEIGGHLIIS